MAEYITKIRTAQGDKQIDYNALANLPDLSNIGTSSEGDMTKAVYDTDNNGIVDNASKLGGQLPSYYAKASDVPKNYANSSSAGGNALFADRVAITRITQAITTIAANVPVDSETIVFGGSDATSYGCPSTYCIINIKKGNNHRTILDCYNLNTGDHYINGNINASDSTYKWTGWILQPNATTLTSYVPKAGTTMTGTLVAQNNTSYTTKQVHNMSLYASTATLPTASTSLNGDVILIYE